jgi:hypothetical protein
MKLADFAAIHDVARKREVRARAARNAVDRADHRHLERAQAEDQRLVIALDRRAEIDGRSRRDGAIAEVLSRAEAAAAPVSSSTRTDASAAPIERVAHFACIWSLKLLRRSGD